jgi:hypothetical protein
VHTEHVTERSRASSYFVKFCLQKRSITSASRPTETDIINDKTKATSRKRLYTICSLIAFPDMLHYWYTESTIHWKFYIFKRGHAVFIVRTEMSILMTSIDMERGIFKIFMGLAFLLMPQSLWWGWVGIETIDYYLLTFTITFALHNLKVSHRLRLFDLFIVWWRCREPMLQASLAKQFVNHDL